MLGLFSETTKLTATDATQSWSEIPGRPAVNALQDQSWQGVYMIVTDGPAHILRSNGSNGDAAVTTSTGARIVAGWPMTFVLQMGDTLSYMRGDDATDDVSMWITRVANK